jgi:RNA polymerase sigma factor (TIGR02999 family)
MANVHQLAAAAHAGDSRAGDELFRLVYDDLRKLAERYLGSERAGHTLQPTALVHEAYVHLLGGTQQGKVWEGRVHLLAAAARAMRHILVDSARRKRSTKRGGRVTREPMDPDHIAAPQTAEELFALTEALEKLAAVEPAIAELVTLRYYGGLTVAEAAEVLGISPRTAAYHWAYARAWLLESLDGS